MSQTEPTETIIRGDHETLQHTIELPEGEGGLTDATDVEWYLRTSPKLGQGEIVLVKTQAGGGVTVLDDATFEVELTPTETEALDPGPRYAEVTIEWGGEPSTTPLSPRLVVEDSAHVRA